MSFKKAVAFFLTFFFLTMAGCSAVVRKPAREMPKTGASAVKTPKAESSPANAEEPRTWMTVEDKPNRFSIKLPGDWTTINLSSDSYKAILDNLSKNNPKMANWLPSRLPDLVAQGLKLFAVEVSPETVESGLAPNLNILTKVLPYHLSPSVLVQMNLKATKAMMNATLVSEPHVIVSAAGKGETFTLLANIKAADGRAVTITTTQTYFVVGKRAFVLTITFPGKPSASQSTLCNQIIASFSLLKNGTGGYPAAKDWKSYPISDSGLTLDLPEKPDIVNAGINPVPAGDSPFIARTMFFACTYMDIHFEVLVGFYARGKASQVEQAFVRYFGRPFAMQGLRALRPEDGIHGDWNYTDGTTEVERAERVERVWTADFTSGKTALHMEGSVLAVDHTVYAVAVYYDKTDKAAAKAANVILRSASIALNQKGSGAGPVTKGD